MMGRSLGIAGLLVAVFLGLPDTSQAQLFRRFGGWRGDAVWYDGGPGYYYDAGYPYAVSVGYRRAYYPYEYSYGYYPRWSTRFGTRYAFYGPTVYGPTVYTQSSPGSYTYRSAYPSPEIVNDMPDPGPSALAAVRVPTANAQLWIEGKEMMSRGLLRTFISPPLESDKDYSYTIRAKWIDNNGKAVDRTQEVPVHAGQRLAVDFTAADSKSRERRSGYGPQGPEAPPPARDGAKQPRRDNGSDKPLPVPKTRPQDPDREDK